MGDARRIDHLRALALSSMPSMARRPAQRRDSGIIDIFEQRKALVSAVPAIPDDKEEGELSSDDETEHTATNPAAAVYSLPLAHRNGGQSLRAPSQGRDGRHKSGATPADSVPIVGLSSASVFSTSTRVSIVNKSQLFSAFTAQAPPLISSSQEPDSVINGTCAGIAARQPKHTFPEIVSGSCLNNFVAKLHHAPAGNSLRASSTTTSQLIPTPPNQSRSQASGNARICETTAEDSLFVSSTGAQTHAPISSPLSPALKLPDQSTMSAVSSFPATASAVGVPDSAGATSGQTLVVSAGSDVSIALGTTPAESALATSGVASAGLRKEAGVRNEAEAFLASLRIPLATSAASGDEKEDAFLIKFDEDSDSDGDNENRTNSTRRHADRSSRKGSTNIACLLTTSVPPPSNPAIPTQSPADLTAEIDRMKEKIAAMERTKGKASIPSVLGKAGRVLPTDLPRYVLPTASEPRPGTHLRPASVDLESMRLRIAAKESELQQRRQRLAVKVPESSRGVNDTKRTGGVLVSSLPPTVRHNQAADSAAAYAGNPIGKPLCEKGSSGYKKEVQARADGIPALALVGPAGATLAGLRRDAEQSGLDGDNDHQLLNGPISNFVAVQVGPLVSRGPGKHQPVPKALKRSRGEEEVGEWGKVPRMDTNTFSGRISAEDSLKATLTGITNDALNGAKNVLPSVQMSKRKAGAGQMSSDKAPPGSLMNSVSVSGAGSEAMKKLKTISGEGRIDAHVKDQDAAHNIQSRGVILTTIFPRERWKSPSKTTASIPDMVDGSVLICDVEPTASLSVPLAVTTEPHRGSTVFLRNSEDAQASLNVIQKFGTNGNADAPTFKARDTEQIAVCTAVAVTDCQQERLGGLNPTSTTSAETYSLHTTQPWRLVDPVASARLDYRLDRASRPGLARIDDNQPPGEEHVSFQQLLEEEELLDKQLEEVQRIRQQCELRERTARREYREAQWALRAANEDCYALNQRKEFLLSRIHAAEARHVPVKSYVERPLIPFGGNVVTQNQNKPEHPPLLVSAPYPLPVTQAHEGSWGEDVSGDRARSVLVRESLSPFSSSRVDPADLAHGDEKNGASAEEGEENSHYKLAKSISSDDKEHESHGHLIPGMENSSAEEGEKNGQAGVVNVERQEVNVVGQEEDIEPESFVGGASQPEDQCYARCESDLNNNNESPSDGLDNSGPGGSDFTAKGHDSGVCRTSASITRPHEFPRGTQLEENEQAPFQTVSLITIECSKEIEGPSLIDDVGTCGHRMGRLLVFCAELDGNPDAAQHQVPRLDRPGVTGDDPDREGSDKEIHDVKQVTASSSSQDAQSVDSLRSAPNSVQDIDTAHVLESASMEGMNLTMDETHIDTINVLESASMEGMNLTMDETVQGDSKGNTSPGTHENDPVLVHLEDYSVDTSAIESPNTDYCVKAGTEDAYAATLSTVCAGQPLPEESCPVVQETGFLENEKEVEYCGISTEYVENVPFDPEGGAVSCPVSPDKQEANEARDGTECRGMESLVEVIDDSVRLTTEPEQSSSHLPPSTNDPVEKETNFDDGDLAHMKNSDVAHADVENGASVILTYSCSQAAPPHLDERKAETIEERVSARLLHSDGATDDSILDLELKHDKDVDSRGVVPGLDLAEDVGYSDGVSAEEDSLSPKPGSYFSNLQEEVDCGLSKEYCVGVAGVESTYFLSDDCLAEETSPNTMSLAAHDTLILQNHDGRAPSQETDPQSEHPFVSQLADGNLSNTELQDYADILEEQDKSEVSQQPDFNMSFDNDNVAEGFDCKKGDPVRGGDKDPCGITDSEVNTDDSETQRQSESGSQDHNAAIAVVAEDQQQDQLSEDMAESGEQQKQDDSEKKESNGADVEVFRKALLDGNMLERRSCSGEVADTTNVRKQSRDEVSTQILPQLQHHRLEHLFDMVEVEVRVPELPSGHALVQEGLQGAEDVEAPVAVDDMLVDAPTVESREVVVQSGAQILLSSTTSENLIDAAELWVPSAKSLAVLSFVPEAISPPSESETAREAEGGPSESGSDFSFGTYMGPLYRYESPLSIFRSYRISPDFHLSRTSSTWSHAINPFKPLCKFEHRGKCNNDDCPWQHADDYSLSAAQVLSQLQNYIDSRGELISDDQDVDVTCIDKDRELATACVASRTGDSPVPAAMAKAPHAGPGEMLPKSYMGLLSSPLNWKDNEVPIYRTGSYVVKAEDPMRTCLSHHLQPDRKVGSLRSFLLSPSIHRPLPPDIPCLLDASETPSWFLEAPAYHLGSLHWRYARDVQEKLTCTKDGGEMQEPIDEEMWLELALHHIDYDISTDDNKARDQALFRLSRALEKKQSSVTLWMVYACLFHTRKDTAEKDDMFHHAVQYNPGSYELWVLYINSRCDFRSRSEAYEKAIVALANEGTHLQSDMEERSAYILDIGLQMLYFWCVSGRSEDSFSWVDDLICEASAGDDASPRRGSSRALLSRLTPHDACVLWIACTYLLACKQLPDCIITLLGCKQELPAGLEWDDHAKDEASHKRVMKALSTAASEGVGCLSLGSTQAVADIHDSARPVLGVSYVQCLSFYEGLESAACLGKELLGLYPSSLELLVLVARIENRREGVSTGLRVFEEAVVQWPQGLPGLQRLWNQYAAHALLWGGKDLAKSILLNCIAAKNSPPETPETPVFVADSDKTEMLDRQGNAVGGWSHLREYFVTLTSVGKRSDGGHQLSQVEDTVYALINLALVEAIGGDIAASQSAVNSAMKAAISHKDLRHCWREVAAFQRVFGVQSGNGKMLEHGILSLLDRCKADSYSLAVVRPLSEKAFQNYKKPHVRKFLDDLIGPPPLDHYVLNSILGTLYGPQLLPSSEFYPLKEVFHFAEGILEAIPGNVRVASSLCRIVSQNRSALKRMYLPAVMWANALLTSSLHQSSPVAPESYWVEAGALLRQLDEERSLEEFYKLALAKYPFSAALRRRLQEVQDRLRVPDNTLSLAVQRKSPALESMPVAVGC